MGMPPGYLRSSLDLNTLFDISTICLGKKTFFIQSFFNQNVFLVIDYEIEIKGNFSKYFKTFIFMSTSIIYFVILVQRE